MKKEKYTAKVITETAIMFALVFLILLITAYVPILSDIGMFVLPIPITLLYIRHNTGIALIAVIMSIVLASLFYNPISALASGISYGFTGIALGYCIKNKKNSQVSILIVGAAGIVSNIIRFMIYAILVNKKGLIEYINLTVDELKRVFVESRNIYISMNAPQEAINAINRFIDYLTVQNLIIIIPIALIISSLIQAYINYFITQKTLKKLRYEVPDLVPFTRIYIPNRFLAVLIIIECLGIILNSRDVKWAFYAVGIGHLIVSFVLSLDGMAYLAYILRERAKIPKGVIAIILIIGIFTPIFSSVFSILGLMDIMLNLRKLDPNPIRVIKPRE
ncbi:MULTISPECIES: DUF2232 domain-containing protein [Clostridium]|uniref:DUF2232 domain-containing protein n=2 Tax=Clostridium TaxID=1485 RepID=A0A151AKI1_9CLOT|nr:MULTISPECIES: YybS family protein [Clostridium]KYH28050.1 hypothetical protein CLCOL_23200 [Clostridium colicanis DSM 13634]MBE6044923.1 DUF2232 domain-containing protein [Clostridium thermopalmarium]PRR71121.1 hypothetical protein CPAL_17810 [Clostridium thermopalmarium DSM 5974]PVZ20989.1 uncharacterized protein YybS (DUF2232 family) [Clostridium thermopalmarium DSM 5974]